MSTPVVAVPKNGLATAGFVLALVAVVFAFIPIVNVVSIPLGLLGLVFGVVGLVKAKTRRVGKGLSVAALVLSVVSFIGFGVSNAALYAAVDAVDQSLEEVEGSVEPVDPESAAEPEVETEVDSEPAGPTLAKFGEAYTYPDGLSISISEPEEFQPSEYAAVDETAASYVRFTVTVDNGTDTEFDPTLVLVTASSAEHESEQVFDIDQKLGGSPSTTVLPGNKVSFDVGFGVQDASDLLVSVTPNDDWSRADALFTH